MNQTSGDRVLHPCSAMTKNVHGGFAGVGPSPVDSPGQTRRARDARQRLFSFATSHISSFLLHNIPTIRHPPLSPAALPASSLPLSCASGQGGDDRWTCDRLRILNLTHNGMSPAHPAVLLLLTRAELLHRGLSGDADQACL